jgi:hypothetical protein
MIEQLQNCVDYFNKIFFKDIPSNISCWIAGGAVRDYFSIGFVQSDIDIYLSDQDNFNSLKYYFTETEKLVPTFENVNVLNFYRKGKKVQLIKIFFQDLPSTIDSFDFTVCCCGVTREEVFYHETFFIDLAKKRLVINKLPYPVSTLRRLQKYILKGYKICNGGIIHIVQAIQQMPQENIEENHLYID